MHTNAPQAHNALRGVVFVKTPAGQAELACRTAQLSGRERSLLIVIDGKRDYHALQRIAPAETLDEALRVLGALGYIANRDLSGAPALDGADAAGDRLMQVKKLMIHSAEGYLGPMAGVLVRRIAAAKDEKQGSSVMGQWHMAMRESKYGRGDVSELIARVAASLADATSAAA